MTPETKVKQEIKEYLTKSGWFHFPIIQNFKKSRGMPGLPDRIAIKNKVVLFIEIKAEDNDLSEDQAVFKDEILAHGGYYVTARKAGDIKDLEDYLKIKEG